MCKKVAFHLKKKKKHVSVFKTHCNQK